MKYLQKRHPLYFINDKLRMDQITDLIERLIYRVKQRETLEKKEPSSEAAPGTKSAFEKKEAPAPIKFQSGKSLPTIDDGKTGGFDFPSLGGGPGFPNPQKQDLNDKAKQMFEDLDLDDVEASGKSKGVDLDFEQGSDSGDGNFNANELLNLTDYQNKRKKQNETKDPKKPGPTNLNIKDVFDPKKLDALNKEDEDDWGMSDDWGDSNF